MDLSKRFHQVYAMNRSRRVVLAREMPPQRFFLEVRAASAGLHRGDGDLSQYAPRRAAPAAAGPLNAALAAGHYSKE